MPHDSTPHYDWDGPIITGERSPLRRFNLTGFNSMRDISFDMVVFASHAGEAVALADQWRRENNKVRAERWRTKEAS